MTTHSSGSNAESTFITSQQARQLVLEEHEKSVEYICDTIYSASSSIEEKTFNTPISRLTSSSAAVKTLNPQSCDIIEKSFVKIMEDYSVSMVEIKELHLSLIANLDDLKQSEENKSAQLVLLINNYRSCMQLLLQNAETTITSCIRFMNLPVYVHIPAEERIKTVVTRQGPFGNMLS